MKYLLASLIVLASGSAMAEDSMSVQVPLDSRVANAGTFSNLRGASDSIKVQAESILTESLVKSQTQPKPSEKTFPGCGADLDKKLIFNASPSKLLQEYSDKQKCEGYFKQTQSKPLSWNSLEFKSIKELSDSFGELSQGKGVIGTELYKKCDGDCSPQYSIYIKSNPDQSVKADITAVCGPARDKDEGTYRLTTTLLWECKK